VVNLGEALDLLFARLGDIGRTAAEDVPLDAALGRVVAEDVMAERPVPDGPRSAMDGFAVAAATLKGASPALHLAGQVLAGGAPPALPAGATVFVATGASLPAGADTVVPRELATWDRSDDSGHPQPGALVRIRQVPAPGTHVMPPGEWVPTATPALPAGTRLGPAAIGLLATLGRRAVSVHRRPRVVILATGDELVAPGEPLPPGGMYDSNAALLAAACAEAGAEPLVLPRVPDRLPDLVRALESALAHRPDLILTSGGVSVGPADLVPGAWRQLGAEEVFWRVAIKPGKPVFAALCRSTAVLGLSGSPTACWTAFSVLAGPLLRHWGGWTQPFPAAQRIRLAEALPANPDMPRLLWSEIGPDGTTRIGAHRAPGVLVRMAAANALVLQGAGSTALPAGAGAWALRIDRVGQPGQGDARALLAAAGRPGALEAAGTDVLVPATGGLAPVPGSVAVCAIGGWSGHGKTTLIERLIAHFAAAGEPVATLKHHAHAGPLDPPGKDGSRHRAAGARMTVVAGPGGLLWSEAVDGEVPPERLLPEARARAARAGCRWLLVEGYHGWALPRVDVLDTTRQTTPRSRPADGLFLIAADDPGRVAAPDGVSVVSREAIEAIAAAIRAAGGTAP
jgi:molybdopterin molybdotransferase